MPIDLPARRRPDFMCGLGPIVLFSIVPWFVSLVLVHSLPAFANAFVLLGQMS